MKIAINPHIRIKVVDNPDDTSDWRVYEYGELEWVTYVQDGEMHEAFHYQN